MMFVTCICVYVDYLTLPCSGKELSIVRNICRAVDVHSTIPVCDVYVTCGFPDYVGAANSQSKYKKKEGLKYHIMVTWTTRNAFHVL